MKILMIAPEPFFEPRGTPFSEYFRIKALSELGHEVDLVTYPLGQNKEIKGLTIHRCKNPFSFKEIKTGPSMAKLWLDVFLFFKVWGRIIKTKYDLIHTHEEANIMGVFFSKISKTPHLYDMHSSLVQQMENFQFTRSKLIIGLFRWVERISLKNAASIIVICRSLFEYAALITNQDKLTLIENYMDESLETLDINKKNIIRQQIKKENQTLILYAGTLEEYQGIPLLINSLKYLADHFELIIIGGRPDQIEKYWQLAGELGLKNRIHFLGIKPAGDIPYYIDLADILVSPRIYGTNIPLKVYSYLKSGRPLVATNIFSHTQTITPEIAVLAEPNAADFAKGIQLAASDDGKKITRQAVNFCRQHYTPQRYMALVNESLKKAITEKNSQ
jgi:glycosyltransferase involved in cell wall biosynthesis